MQEKQMLKVTLPNKFNLLVSTIINIDENKLSIRNERLNILVEQNSTNLDDAKKAFEVEILKVVKSAAESGKLFDKAKEVGLQLVKLDRDVKTDKKKRVNKKVEEKEITSELYINIDQFVFGFPSLDDIELEWK